MLGVQKGSMRTFGGSNGLTVLTATAVLPTPAWAAPSTWPVPMDWLLAAVGLGALGVAVAIYVNARRRDRELARETGLLAADNAGLQALLGTAPGGCCGWTVDGAELRAVRLSGVLGLASDGSDGFEGLAEAFEADDFALLREAVRALRADNEPFAIDLRSPGGTRVFAAQGTVMRDQGGTVLGHVVWFRDVSEERHALAQLRRQAAESAAERDRVQELADNVPLPLWRRDAACRLVWCNQAYADLFEDDREAVLASPGRELASAHDPLQGRRLAARAVEEGQSQVERRYFVVGGERRAFEVIEVPLPGGGLVGQARDVTDREQARAELVRHLDANREVLQSVSTAIAIFGPDKRLQLYNKAYADLWHLEESVLDGSPHFTEVLEAQRERRRLPEQADFQAFKRELVELFSTVIDTSAEDTMHLPDGTALKVFIAPHSLGGLVFMYEDVTNQLDLERAHRTLSAVQRASLDNLYEGVVVYGSDGRLKLHNPAFARIWGIAEARLADEPHIADVIDAISHLYGASDAWPREKDRMMSLWIERLAKSGRINRPDGKVIDYASVPLPDGAVLFTYLDVTDSNRIERALRERNEALETADRLKSEFIANVSYELRTPLNTIIGFTEILANQYFGKLNDHQMEYSKGILDSSQHLLLLINDILDLATVEAGHMSLETGPFDLRALLDSVLALGRERARQENLTIKLDCPDDIGSVEADERRIKQVMFKLLSNAIKFTPAGGDITVGALREGESVLLWVKDTGVGIAADERDRVFEKFHKGKGPDRHGGAGLGLSLVKSFIELHGGSVELESSPRQGTRITCRLPVRPALQAEGTAAAE